MTDVDRELEAVLRMLMPRRVRILTLIALKKSRMVQTPMLKLESQTRILNWILAADLLHHVSGTMHMWNRFQ